MFVHRPDGGPLRTALDALIGAFIGAANLAVASRDLGVAVGFLCCLALMAPIVVVTGLLGVWLLLLAVASSFRSWRDQPLGGPSPARADRTAIAEGIAARARANEAAYDRARWAEREGMPGSAQVWLTIAENDRGTSAA